MCCKLAVASSHHLLVQCLLSACHCQETSGGDAPAGGLNTKFKNVLNSLFIYILNPESQSVPTGSSYSNSHLAHRYEHDIIEQ